MYWLLVQMHLLTLIRYEQQWWVWEWKKTRLLVLPQLSLWQKRELFSSWRAVGEWEYSIHSVSVSNSSTASSSWHDMNANWLEKKLQFTTFFRPVHLCDKCGRGFTRREFLARHKRETCRGIRCKIWHQHDRSTPSTDSQSKWLKPKTTAAPSPTVPETKVGNSELLESRR